MKLGFNYEMVEHNFRNRAVSLQIVLALIHRNEMKGLCWIAVLRILTITLMKSHIVQAQLLLWALLLNLFIS